MNHRSAKKRIEIVDIAKCIVIILVVLGHTATNTELLGEPSLFYRIIYSVHMPLFFFLSGLTIPPRPLNTRESRRLFARKLILTLVIPFLIWSLIYCSFSLKSLGYILYGSGDSLVKAGTVSFLWILSCLCIARILVQIVIMVMSRLGLEGQRAMYVIPALLFLMIGGVFPSIEIGYPWCFDVAFVAAACMLLGVASKRLVQALSVQKDWVLGVLLVVFICVYALGVISAGDGFVLVIMSQNTYGNPLNELIFAISGSGIVLTISMLLKRLSDERFTGIDLSAINYMGQHTLAIFLLHKPLLQSIFCPLFLRIFGESNLMLSRILAAILVLPACLLLCRLIECFIPELMGVYSRDRIQGEPGRIQDDPG